MQITNNNNLTREHTAGLAGSIHYNFKTCSGQAEPLPLQWEPTLGPGGEHLAARTLKVTWATTCQAHDTHWRPSLPAGCVGGRTPSEYY